MGAKHTITITFESNDDLLNHPVLEMVAHDMKVQLESLVDGSYDENEHGTKGKDTNTWNITTHVDSKDTTKFLSDSVREKLKEGVANTIMQGAFGDGMEEDYAMEGTTILGVNQMTDHELMSQYEGYVDDGDDCFQEACAELEVHNMLKGK